MTSPAGQEIAMSRAIVANGIRNAEQPGGRQIPTLIRKVSRPAAQSAAVIRTTHGRLK
jgi:hypothetical protein